MTKSKHTNRRKKPTFSWRPAVMFLFIVIIAAAIVYVLYLLRPQETNSPETDQPAAVTQPTPETPTEAPSPEQPTKPEEPEEKAIQYEGEDTNKLPELTGSITRKTIADGKLTVVAIIDQYLQNNGTCIAKLQDARGNVIYTGTSVAAADITASFCEPFEIPVQQLSGSYHIVITLSGEGKSGEIREEVNL